MSEVGARRDEQPLDLMERVQVARVVVVAPVHAPGHDDRDRRRVLLHRTDLHRRRVGAQHEIGTQVERVEALAGGMIGRDVERVEVVVIAFDFGPEQHREAAPLEVAGDVVQRAPHRMDRALQRCGAGKRDVDDGGELALEAGVRESLAAALHEQLFERRGGLR